MEPTNTRFGGGAASTALHPFVAIAVLVAIVLILFLPRKYVIVPLLLTTFFVPLGGQEVVITGVHFTVIRLLALFCCARLVVSRLSRPIRVFAGGFTPIDQAFAIRAFVNVLSFSLLWLEWRAIINRLGFLMDTLAYLVLRFLIRDREDVKRAIIVFTLIAVVMAIFMIREQMTGQNIFWSITRSAKLDGSSMGLSDIRDGQIRSQGAFTTYLTAGAFGATLLPLLAWLWSDKRSKVVACLGMVGASVMTLTSNSSTPLLAYAAGMLALCFWPLRGRMRLIRWGTLITLVALHLVLKVPVWALISRVDLTGSSSSYHRYMLMDTCIRHFSDWWLLGTKDNSNWGWEMWDTSNQYVSEAVSGGLAALVMFTLIISRSFGRLGTARKLAHHERKREWFLWCLGAALFAHVVGYFGVGYDSQMQVAWFALLAIISAATCETLRPAAARVEVLGDSHIPSIQSERSFTLTRSEDENDIVSSQRNLG